MDKREEMKGIVKNGLLVPFGKIHSYPNISDKVKAKITKNFDANVNTNNVVAFCDTTLIRNGKNGIVFMLAGTYYHGLLEKPFYFNYADIVDMNIIPDKKGNTSSLEASIKISFSNGNSLTIGLGNFNKENLKEVLSQLKTKALSYDDIVCIKPSGEVGKVLLTKDQKTKCNGIIHTAATAAGAVGTGLAQIPLSDNAVITPIQITMIISLGAVFGIRVTEGVAKGIIGGAAASIVGRGVVQLIVGWIPGLGNAINTATAAGLTEAIGWMTVAHFFDLQQQDKAKYKVDGMKEGYNAASEEYEGKLRKQADEFIKQQKVYKEETERYEQLLSEFEEYIRKLEKEQKERGTAIASLPALKAQHGELSLLKVV